MWEKTCVYVNTLHKKKICDMEIRVTRMGEILTGLEFDFVENLRFNEQFGIIECAGIEICLLAFKF